MARLVNENVNNKRPDVDRAVKITTNEDTTDVEIASEHTVQKYGQIKNKTAELSQRRPRDAPNIWVH